MKYLTEREYDRFITQPDLSLRNRTMFAIAYQYGLRASEIQLLTRADIDLDRNRISVTRLKGSWSGEYTLGPKVRSLLTAFLPTAGDPLFPIKRCQVYLLFRRYAHLAGLPAAKCHPHVLKHSIATHLLDAGLDLVEVQDWLGHRQIKNTQIYAQVTNKRRMAAAEKIFGKA